MIFRKKVSWNLSQARLGSAGLASWASRARRPCFIVPEHHLLFISISMGGGTPHKIKVMLGGPAAPPDPPCLCEGAAAPSRSPRWRSPDSLELFSSYQELLQPPGSSVSAFFALQKSPKKFHTFLKLIIFSFFKPWDPSHRVPHVQNTFSHALPNP